MIGGITKFGGSARDAKALVAHLGKEQPGGATFEAFNSISPTMAAIVEEARLAASSRGIGDRPFWHVNLSPSASMDEEGLQRAIRIVCREFGVTSQPIGVEVHRKPRREGGAGAHAHLVIGRAGWDGALLPSGFEKLRLETACRVIEYECGEPHVRGKHLRASVRYLIKSGRMDVAQSLKRAFPDLEPAEGGLSPEKRKTLERQGIDVIEKRAIVRAAWQRAKDPTSFANMLAKHELMLVRGDKQGVWIVQTTDSRRVIGALDRLVQEKRRDIYEKMKINNRKNETHNSNKKISYISSKIITEKKVKKFSD